MNANYVMIYKYLCCYYFLFLQVTNDVIQSYAQVMPSPDPIIESLFVRGGFSNVAKLRQIKINNALVVALCWIKWPRNN